MSETDHIDALINDGGPEAEASEDATQQLLPNEAPPEGAEEADKAAEPEDEAKQAEDDKSEEQPKTVPLGALHEERGRRQALQNEVGELKSTIQRMEKVFEQFRTVQQPGQADKQAELPDPNIDPDGWYRGKIEALESELSEIKGKDQQREEQDRSTQASNELLEKYASDVRRFSADTPDYMDAYEHFGKTADKTLQEAGISDPQRRSYLIQLWEGNIVGAMLDVGESPAKAMYLWSKMLGYAPAEKNNGADENRLEQLQKGQRASRSLGATKGAGEGEMSLERLAGLDGDEFDQMFAKMARRGQL